MAAFFAAILHYLRFCLSSTFKISVPSSHNTTLILIIRLIKIILLILRPVISHERRSYETKKSRLVPIYIELRLSYYLISLADEINMLKLNRDVALEL